MGQAFDSAEELYDEIVRQMLVQGCCIIPIDKKLEIEKDQVQNRINYINYCLKEKVPGTGAIYFMKLMELGGITKKEA